MAYKSHVLCRFILAHRLAVGTFARFEQIIKQAINDYGNKYKWSVAMKEKAFSEVQRLNSEALERRETFPVAVTILGYDNLCSMNAKTIDKFAEDERNIHKYVSEALERLSKRFKETGKV